MNSNICRRIEKLEKQEMASNVRLSYDGAMRLHITIKDESMAVLRKMAKEAGCTGNDDREILQAYLHHITNAEPPQWGGARKKSRKRVKKTTRDA